MKTFEIEGTYGSHKTPCPVYVAEMRNGLKWYVADGGTMVNATYEDICEGCDIEELADVDCFTWSKPIESIEELENAIND